MNRVKTTIRLDLSLIAEVKRLAATTNRTLTAVIEDALRELVAQQRRRITRSVGLTIVDGNGVSPGVEIDDTAALINVMDGHRGPA